MEMPKPAHHPDRAKYHHVPQKARPSAEFRAKYIALQDQIAKSATSREPSPSDVESFEDSYRKLGLDRRFGPLDSGQK